MKIFELSQKERNIHSVKKPPERTIEDYLVGNYLIENDDPMYRKPLHALDEKTYDEKTYDVSDEIGSDNQYNLKICPEFFNDTSYVEMIKQSLKTNTAKKWVLTFIDSTQYFADNILPNGEVSADNKSSNNMMDFEHENFSGYEWLIIGENVESMELYDARTVQSASSIGRIVGKIEFNNDVDDDDDPVKKYYLNMSNNKTNLKRKTKLKKIVLTNMLLFDFTFWHCPSTIETIYFVNCHKKNKKYIDNIMCSNSQNGPINVHERIPIRLTTLYGYNIRPEDHQCVVIVKSHNDRSNCEVTQLDKTNNNLNYNEISIGVNIENPEEATKKLHNILEIEKCKINNLQMLFYYKNTDNEMSNEDMMDHDLREALKQSLSANIDIIQFPEIPLAIKQSIDTLSVVGLEPKECNIYHKDLWCPIYDRTIYPELSSYRISNVAANDYPPQVELDEKNDQDMECIKYLHIDHVRITSKPAKKINTKNCTKMDIFDRESCIMSSQDLEQIISDAVVLPGYFPSWTLNKLDTFKINVHPIILNTEGNNIVKKVVESDSILNRNESVVSKIHIANTKLCNSQNMIDMLPKRYKHVLIDRHAAIGYIDSLNAYDKNITREFSTILLNDRLFEIKPNGQNEYSTINSRSNDNQILSVIDTELLTDILNIDAYKNQLINKTTYCVVNVDLWTTNDSVENANKIADLLSKMTELKNILINMRFDQIRTDNIRRQRRENPNKTKNTSMLVEQLLNRIFINSDNNNNRKMTVFICGDKNTKNGVMGDVPGHVLNLETLANLLMENSLMTINLNSVNILTELDEPDNYLVNPRLLLKKNIHLVNKNQLNEYSEKLIGESAVQNFFTQNFYPQNQEFERLHNLGFQQFHNQGFEQYHNQQYQIRRFEQYQNEGKYDDVQNQNNRQSDKITDNKLSVQNNNDMSIFDVKINLWTQQDSIENGDNLIKAIRNNPNMKIMSITMEMVQDYAAAIRHNKPDTRFPNKKQKTSAAIEQLLKGLSVSDPSTLKLSGENKDDGIVCDRSLDILLIGSEKTKNGNDGEFPSHVVQLQHIMDLLNTNPTIILHLIYVDIIIPKPVDESAPHQTYMSHPRLVIENNVRIVIENSDPMQFIQLAEHNIVNI